MSLGEFSTVGNMMGGLIGGSLMIEGAFARMMYVSLYKMHELALHGFCQGRARHAGAPDHAAHRAAREAALTLAHAMEDQHAPINPHPTLWLTDLMAKQQRAAEVAHAARHARGGRSGDPLRRPGCRLRMPLRNGSGKRSAADDGVCGLAAVPAGAATPAVDRRFAADAWRQDPRFDGIARGYLSQFGTAARRRSMPRRSTSAARRNGASRCARWSTP